MASVISKQLVTTTIDLPFSFSNGRVASILDTDLKVWKNRIISLLSTATNERVWYYDYGANLNNLLFETSEVAVQDAKYAIEQMFGSWLPSLSLIDIVVGYDSTTGTLSITITYKLPSGDVDSVKINTESLSPSGDIIKVTS
jgi:phage baseplate assembly protein W